MRVKCYSSVPVANDGPGNTVDKRYCNGHYIVFAKYSHGKQQESKNTRAEHHKKICRPLINHEGKCKQIKNTKEEEK